MNKTSGTSKDAADKLVRDIKRKARKHDSAEEKIRIVLAGLRGKESIAALCRRKGIAVSLYYNRSKEFLEAGKSRCIVQTISLWCASAQGIEFCIDVDFIDENQPMQVILHG